jgi:hypothetical protein
MSFRPAREPERSILQPWLFMGVLAALLAGSGVYVYAAFRPLQLPNPGLAAYHPPAAVELLGIPGVALSSAPLVEALKTEVSASVPAARPTEVTAQKATSQVNADGDSHAGKKSAHLRPHNQNAVASNSAASGQWNTQWSPPQWQNQWPSREATQAYGQWTPRVRDDHRAPAQGRPHSAPNQGTMTFAQFGAQRPW